MAVYVDKVFDWPGKVAPAAREHGTHWCHMWCDEGDEEEMHQLAERIGLRRAWHQTSARGFGHYDLVPSKRKLAIKAGAGRASLRAWLHGRMFPDALKTDPIPKPKLTQETFLLEGSDDET